MLILCRKVNIIQQSKYQNKYYFSNCMVYLVNNNTFDQDFLKKMQSLGLFFYYLILKQLSTNIKNWNYTRKIISLWA